MAHASTESRIHDNSHATNCFEGFQSLWQSEQLCDLTLKVAGIEFKVHKLILVASSKYFKNMFTQELFVENDKNCIELRQVNPNIFRVILEYFYSGYIVLSEDTAERVLATADFFSLTEVKSICAKYLLKNIDINNCIARYCMGVTFGLTEFECETKSFILDKLDEVSKTSHFQKINQDILKNLLTTTKPNTSGELIYTAIMNWLEYDFDNRKLFLSDLVDLIPTENISYDFYINSMKNETILRQDCKCMAWLLDNVVDKFTKLNVGASGLETNLFITCQWGNKSECFQLQLKSKKINPVSARPDITRFSAISYKESIYLTAGSYDDKNLEKSYKYDTHENCWSEINLNFERRFAGACILHDQLFIVGGCSQRSTCCFNSCTYYDFNSNKICNLTDMKEKRCVPGMGVYQNSVYICCGWNGSANLSSIGRYDPREGLWQNVGKYKFVSGPCSSAVTLDFLCTCKQYGGLVERFDFRNNSSEELSKPVVETWNWIAHSQEKLFKVHGTGLSEYNVNNNQWLDKKYKFSICWPVVVSWDST